MLSPGVLVYFGPGGVADDHRHHAVQVVRSFDGPFEVELPTGRSLTRTAVIASGVRHRVRSGARRHAIVLVDPETGGARRQEVAGRTAEIAEAVMALPPPARSADEVAAFGAAVAAAVGREQLPISAPVRDALVSIDDQLPERPRLAEAARCANLSPSHLTHRFSAEIGVPFRRYVLWRRLWRLARCVSAGDNLTTAALDAGFSDSSHCSRVFRATFGVPASVILDMDISWADWPDAVSRNVQVPATGGP